MLVGRQNNLQMARDQTGIAFGLGGGADSNNQPRRSFQHIEDLMVAPAGLSELTSIKDLLRQAEIYLKQALASKSFGRADFALRDYCCARAILDGLIKKNKDWAKLMGGDKKALLGQYEYLVHQAKQLEAEFESVKQEVVENNRLTGVQPTSRPASSHTGGSTLTRGPIDAQNLRPDGSTSGATVTRHHNDQVNGYGYVLKAKPVVLPKPPSLLGNAIKRGGGGPAAASKTSQDLAKRFANLRSSTALSPAPPAFDDTAPKQPRLDTSFCSALPDLPKLPDAIYSPARGTVSSEAAELPSSTPHGIFSRTNSVTSLAGNPKPAKSPLINDYFVPAQSFGGPAARAKRSKPPIPEGNTISPQDLVALMQAGTKQIAILLVDIRPRDEFEMGHIMSQATICIEPDVLLRKDIGAEDIRDSMVVGHSTELKLFEERHRFDLVVFYDASSTRVPLRASKTEDMVVLGLYNALNLYDPAADGDTGRAPKLLRGGIKEWTQLMGSTSLQSSSSGPAPTPGKTTGVSADASHRRASRFNPKPIQDAEEAAHWQTALTDKEAYSHVRSTDDFLRRFPEVGNIQSMSSSSPPQTVSYSAVPAPPTRPAPALPRSSHSGLEDPGVMVQSAQVRKAGTALRQAAGHRRPGLRNPHNWCYANSTLQALFSTRGFSHDLSSGDWIGQYRVPQKKEELINNPQILAKCLQSLFFVLDDGKVEVLDSGVLMVSDTSGRGNEWCATLYA